MPAERAILHAEGDPWDGLVIRILSLHRGHVRARLLTAQRPLAKDRRRDTRRLSTSDLF